MLTLKYDFFYVYVSNTKGFVMECSLKQEMALSAGIEPAT